ncbi:MAG: hypothetical protein FJX71_05115 [Alphaproteobacteria bacterium]|nr:hypothetical protein [Alphaproteobacteria bacterium]
MWKVVLSIFVFISQITFAEEGNSKQGKTFLEIFKADMLSQKDALLESQKEACDSKDIKCKERLGALMFNPDTKPDAVKEYQILCYRCCLGEVHKEECSDFGNWKRKKKCGCQ